VTRESCLRTLNASVSLDPVGLSYILPRLGKEFQQAAGIYADCGIILGLTGYEADAKDIYETSLATHYLESATVLGLLERTLAEIQQNLLKTPVHFDEESKPTYEHRSLTNHYNFNTFSAYTTLPV
jgi:hypothetical protein